MQITLKTLQQQTFKIDIDEEETVRVAAMHWWKGMEWELGMSWNGGLLFSPVSNQTIDRCVSTADIF